MLSKPLFHFLHVKSLTVLGNTLMHDGETALRETKNYFSFDQPWREMTLSKAAHVNYTRQAKKKLWHETDERSLRSRRACKLGPFSSDFKNILLCFFCPRNKCCPSQKKKLIRKSPPSIFLTTCCRQNPLSWQTGL